jgi:hypothetical protein
MAAGASAIVRVFQLTDIEERLAALERQAPHAQRLG